MDFLRQHYSHYNTEVGKIIETLNPASVDIASINKAQLELDELAKRYQKDEQLGARRYKMYQAQAMIYYRLGDYVGARQFINRAISVRGESYQLADTMLHHLDSANKKRKSIKPWITLLTIPFAVFGAIAILQLVLTFMVADSGADNSTVVTSINVISLIAGIVALILLLLYPVWIIMLTKTVNYNDSLSSGNAIRLSKIAAILFAVLFGSFAWLYTYERDKTKFWVNLILTIATLTLWSIVGWIWAIVYTVNKSDEYYQRYPNIKD